MPASMFSNLSTESRKGYSLIEKKNILQYIIEHNAYDQVKGRSFWIQFENSKFTTRTWQSLKEVYLKRILKDLRNPYYSLSETEIRKFKTGSNAFSNLKTLKWAQKNNTSFKNRSIKNTSITSDVEKNKSSKTTDIIEKNNVSNIKDFLKPKSPVKKKNDSDIEIIPSTSQTSPILINSRDYESSVNSTSNSKENDKYSHKSSAENGDQSSESDDVLLNSQSLSNNIMPTSTPKKNKITQQLKEKQDSINPINENNNNQLGSNDNNSPKKLKERSTLSKADEIRKEFLQLFCSSEESEPEEGKLIGDNQFKTNTILNSQHVKTVDENQHETYAAKNETEKIKTVDENQHGTNAAKKETEKIKTVDENQRTANMFGFSSGMLKQTSDLKRKRFDSIEIVNTNEVRPCTSKYLSPSRPHKKTFKRERTFVDLDSTDLDSSEGSCSESDVSYYRGSEPENRKRRGSKIFGMYNGQIIPLYEPKRKCCMRRQQIILHNKRKQDKRSRKKPSVYIDHEDVQPSQMLMNQPSDKIDMGDNSACETLNYWKLKYHSKERENDFLLRFIQMLNPSSIPPSILPSTSHPMVLENVLPNNKPHNDATLNTNTNKESISTKPNLKELSPIKNDTGTNSNKDENLPPEAGNSTQTKKETVVIVPSKNSNCEINGTKYVDAKNVVVIDTQKSDILFELLKKLGDMKQPIDVNKIELSSFSNKEKNEDSPSKQKRIASKSASNAATPTQAMKTRSSKEKEIPDESRKTDIYLAKIQPVSNQDSELPKEIEKIRNKEKQIFDKILAEKTPEESNVNRKLFSSLEIDMLLYGKTNENPTDEKKTPGNTSTKQKKKSTSSSPMGTDGESDNKRQLRTRNREVKEVNNTSTKSIKSKDVQDNSTQSSENVKSNPLRKKGKNQTSAVEPGEGGSPQNSPVDRKSKSPRVSHLVKGQSFNVEENQAVNKPIIAETIDENAKFKINPKFLSKLFPTKEKVEMSKNPKKPHSDDDIVPPSSDSEAEETRYAFASSFFNSRKIKNRRSSERSVNLKWFPERKTKPINKNKTDNNVKIDMTLDDIIESTKHSYTPFPLHDIFQVTEENYDKKNSKKWNILLDEEFENFASQFQNKSSNSYMSLLHETDNFSQCIDHSTENHKNSSPEIPLQNFALKPILPEEGCTKLIPLEFIMTSPNLTLHQKETKIIVENSSPEDFLRGNIEESVEVDVIGSLDYIPDITICSNETMKPNKTQDHMTSAIPESLMPQFDNILWCFLQNNMDSQKDKRESETETSHPTFDSNIENKTYEEIDYLKQVTDSDYSSHSLSISNSIHSAKMQQVNENVGISKKKDTDQEKSESSEDFDKNNLSLKVEINLKKDIYKDLMTEEESLSSCCSE